MYQAYVVQEVGGDLCNIILGDHFVSVDAAYRAICTYEQNFGKCKSAAIDPAGAVIPYSEKPKKSLKETILSWL